MRPAARTQAAIDVLTELLGRYRPASAALADWGKAHRYAGSGDRAAIGTLVFDALRRRASATEIMGSDTPRAMVLGALKQAAGLSADEIAALCDGGQHAPAALTAAELTALTGAETATLSPAAQAELPDWVLPLFDGVFGDRAAAEGRALAERAPVDLRINTLKTDRAGARAALADFDIELTPWSALGLRIAAATGGKRQPSVEADLSHGRGWFEVQDEGSQIAAALTGAKTGERVLDLCAGAGGKTLAMAAAMGNRGVLVAYDEDKLRLRPIMERLTRSGVTIVEPLAAAELTQVSKRGPEFDCVLVDAPCTGSGTWRRKPDAKWRLKPKNLVTRLEEQRTVLAEAARHVRPGGRLVYVTCSVFAAENGDQVTAFADANPEYRIVPTVDMAAGASEGALTTLPTSASTGPGSSSPGLLLTPATHGTDGFYVAVLQRRAA